MMTGSEPLGRFRPSWLRTRFGYRIARDGRLSTGNFLISLSRGIA
jgi:hypothetical protein